MKKTTFTLFVSAWLLCLFAVSLHAQMAYQFDRSGNLTNTAPAAPAPPTITVPPQNQVIVSGSDIAFSVLATGPGPLSYQWLSNGIPITGATNDTLVLPGSIQAGYSEFSVVVCNDYGCVTNTQAAFVGTQRTWTGLSDTSWFNPMNWSPFGAPTTNDALIVRNGTSSLSAPFTITRKLTFENGTISGSALTIASGASMQWTGGTLNAPITFSPGASLSWSGGMLNGPLTFSSGASLTWTGGTLNTPLSINSAMSVNWPAVTVNSTVTLASDLIVNWTGVGPAGTGTFVNYGVLNVSCSLAESITVASGAAVNWSVGTLAGSLVVQDGANVNWNGGTANGPVTIASGGAMNCSDGSVSVLTVASNGLLTINNETFFGTVTNAGTVRWTGGRLDGYGSSIENQPGGLWDIQCDQGMSDPSATTTFRNAGTLQKSSGAGTTYISFSLSNSGTVTALQGTLAFTRGGVIEGSFNAAAGATISFTGGNFTYSTLPVLTGPGSFTLNGGSLTMLNDVPPGLQLVSGTVALGPAFQGGSITNLTLGAGVALSGAIRVSGTLTTAGGLSSGSLVASNGATVTFNGGTLGGSVLVQGGATVTCNNSSVSAVTVASNGLLIITNWMSFVALTNAGTVRWTEGRLDGYGSSIENQPGGLWDIQCDQGTSDPTGSTTFRNAGTLQKSSGAGTTYIGFSFTNTGTVTALQGTLAFTGGFTPTGGTLKFGLSGTSSFGRMSIPGNATLGGTVGATLLGGFSPGLSNSFPVLTYSSRTGSFTNADLPFAESWQLNYGATTFSLLLTNALWPQITAQPASTNVLGGQTVSLGVTATGAAPLAYQWQHDGTGLATQTNAILTLPNFQASDAGNYNVVVSNTYGSVTSAVAAVMLITCLTPPTNMVAWWRAEGNALDFVGTSNGALIGGATYGAGKAGSGFVLNGTDAEIQVPDSPSLNPTNQITIEAWYYPTNFSGNGGNAIVDKGYYSHTSPY